MVETTDAAKLRENWREDRLGEFEGQWIAFRNGEVENTNLNLNALLERYASDIREGISPIFAFVWFKGFQ